jgi:hypothetical protein
MPDTWGNLKEGEKTALRTGMRRFSESELEDRFAERDDRVVFKIERKTERAMAGVLDIDVTREEPPVKVPGTEFRMAPSSVFRATVAELRAKHLWRSSVDHNGRASSGLSSANTRRWRAAGCALWQTEETMIRISPRLSITSIARFSTSHHNKRQGKDSEGRSSGLSDQTLKLYNYLETISDSRGMSESLFQPTSSQEAP